MKTASKGTLVFGKYEIMRRIAVGGMGEIFLARESNVVDVERYVILKSLLPQLAAQPGFIDAFLDEARVASTLNHPNIVSMYEVGSWKGIYYICMEYIEGESLAGFLRQCGVVGKRMPPAVAARVIRDAALGLNHAHEALRPDGSRLEIVHRDVSPQNIMVRLDGVTKVVDFGIALARTRQTRTSTGIVKGKVRYLAPEQLAQERELDGRTDQYSLGITFWELLTGVNLYDADNEALMLHKVTTQTIEPPSTRVPDLPEAFDAIVMRMVQRRREDRFPDCRAVAEAIDSEIFSNLQQASSEAVVSEFATYLLGDVIADRRRVVEPSENFVVQLSQGSAFDEWKNTTPTGVLGRRKSHRGALAAAIAGVAIAAGLIVWPILRYFPASDAQATPQPPTEVPAVVVAEPPPVTVVENPAPEPPIVSAALTPRPKSPRHDTAIADERPGYLSVRTVPWTRVTVGGRSYGSTPVVKIQLSPGTHAIHLVNDERHISVDKKIDIRPGEVTKLDLALE